MASKHQFHKGDRVQWPSGDGLATGTVQKRITQDQTVEGNPVSATPDDPRYLVENDHTGTVTGHKPETLSPVSSSGSGSDASGGDSDAFQKGDRVQWNTAQGKTTGTVQEKLTSQTDIKGYTAQASEEEPQYLVESDSTGEQAAHKPDALEKVD